MSVVPIRSQKADKVADELIKIFSSLGVPRTIRTDASSTSKSELLTCFEQKLGVRPHISAPYHHASQAQ